MKRVLVINGPNLNLLGQRETNQYGAVTLDEINQQLIAQGKKHKIDVRCMQSNSESELVDLIHSTKDNKIDYIIINPAAFTHTSIALRDALLAIQTPFIEVHISNVYAREEFRQHSYFSDIAQGIIVGFGPMGYQIALNAIVEQIN